MNGLLAAGAHWFRAVQSSWAKGNQTGFDIHIYTHTHTHTCIHTYTLPTPSRQGSLQLKTAGFTKCAVQTNVPFFLIPRIK